MQRKATLESRLKYLGLSYAEYLRSDHWQEVRHRFRQSRLPQSCLVCDAKSVQLHHRTYVRLGCEELTDLIPLCDDCHRRVYEYEKANPVYVKDTHAILKAIFGWSHQKMLAKFEPYRLPGRPNGCFVNPSPTHCSPEQLRQKRVSGLAQTKARLTLR